MKKILIMIIVPMLLIGMTWEIEDVEQLVSQGIEYYNHGNYDEAHRHVNKAIEICTKEVEKGNEEALYYRAELYWLIEEFDKSIEDLNNLIDINPDSEYYLARGIIMEEINEYEEALKDYSSALELNNDLHQVYYLRAGGYAFLEDYDKALEEIKKYIENEPKSEEGNYLLAYIMIKLGEDEEAIDFLDKFILEELTNFGEKYYKETETDTWEDYLEKALYYLEKGDYSKALRDVNNSIKLKEVAENYFLRGKIYYYNDLFKYAEEDFNKAIEIDKNFYDGYAMLAQLYNYLNYIYGTIIVSNEMINLEPTNPEAYYYLSLAYFQIGELEKANEAYSNYYKYKYYKYK